MSAILNLQSPQFPYANCTVENSEWFFPLDREELKEAGKDNPVDRKIQRDNTERAKGLCASCVHRKDCLTWANENVEEGIWGGTTKSERVIANRQPRTETKVDLYLLVSVQRFQMGLTKYAVAKSLGINPKTVERCIAKAQKLGIL